MKENQLTEVVRAVNGPVVALAAHAEGPRASDLLVRAVGGRVGPGGARGCQQQGEQGQHQSGLQARGRPGAHAEVHGTIHPVDVDCNRV